METVRIIETMRQTRRTLRRRFGSNCVLSDAKPIAMWLIFPPSVAFACLASSAPLSIAPAIGPFDFVRSNFVRVGHEAIAPDPTIRRYTGMVAALGLPDSQGKRYTFRPSPVGPRNFPLSTGDLRGWRMTMLSGKRFGEVFRVSGNTASEITVTSDTGPIEGLDTRDLFVIESIDENGASMFAPAGGGSTTSSPNV